MPKPELLPGVTSAVSPPSVVCDAHAAIRSARRRAWVRDGLQLFLLLTVDGLFAYWPDSRMPFLARHASLFLLCWMNVAILGHVWLMRALPRWTARRIATTWCRAEREKFHP